MRGVVVAAAKIFPIGGGLAKNEKTAFTLLAARTAPLNPIVDTPGSIYDDKTAVVNAGQRGGIGGSVMPLLLDLARKPNYLHESTVPTPDALLNPSRGATAPHAFYFDDHASRDEMVAYLRGLSTTRDAYQSSRVAAMRTFFGHVVCECESVRLVCYAVTTPDATMEITGHHIFCMDCVANFHDVVEKTVLLRVAPPPRATKRRRPTSSTSPPDRQVVKAKR